MDKVTLFLDVCDTLGHHYYGDDVNDSFGIYKKGMRFPSTMVNRSCIEWFNLACQTIEEEYDRKIDIIMVTSNCDGGEGPDGPFISVFQPYLYSTISRALDYTGGGQERGRAVKEYLIDNNLYSTDTWVVVDDGGANMYRCIIEDGYGGKLIVPISYEKSFNENNYNQLIAMFKPQ